MQALLLKRLTSKPVAAYSNKPYLFSCFWVLAALTPKEAEHQPAANTPSHNQTQGQLFIKTLAYAKARR
jgi:hypothetical protein